VTYVTVGAALARFGVVCSAQKVHQTRTPATATATATPNVMAGWPALGKSKFSASHAELHLLPREAGRDGEAEY
jgi:hypothetical protein